MYSAGGILGKSEIKRRFFEIFKPGTAELDNNIDAASYNLRIAKNGLLFGGEWYSYKENTFFDEIIIKQGEVVLLSTMEEFTMPTDLVGNVNVKFKYAQKGLISLFGSRVDPGYGQDFRDDKKREEAGESEKYEGQRLYLFASNIGDNPISLRPGDKVFMVEFYTTIGDIVPQSRPNNDIRMDRRFSNKSNRTFGYVLDIGKKVAILEKDTKDLSNKYNSQTAIQKYLILGIGAVLVITILGEVLSFFYTFPVGTLYNKLIGTESSQSLIPHELVGYINAIDKKTISVYSDNPDKFKNENILKVYRITDKYTEKFIGIINIISNKNDHMECIVLSSEGRVLLGDIVRRPN